MQGSGLSPKLSQALSAGCPPRLARHGIAAQAVLYFGGCILSQERVRRPQKACSDRRSPEPEDTLELEPHRRMEDLAKQRERHPVAHHVFYYRHPSPTVAEAVGVLPDAIGAAQLLVHKPDRRLPAGDKRLP